MSHGPQHTEVSSWKRAIDKFVEETCDIIQGHYHCQIIKNGQIYLGCLWPHGYIDYAFLLLLDDPHANKSLAVRMSVDAAMMAPQAPSSVTQSAPTRTSPTIQPVPETTGLDVIVEEEIVKVEDDGAEQGQAKEDKETTILSMIQVYQEANVPPPTPDTPCSTCATQGEASREQSTDTKMTSTVVSLLLSCPTPAEMVLSSEMSQQLGLAPGTLPNLEQNVQESVSLSKQVDLIYLRDKS